MPEIVVEKELAVRLIRKQVPEILLESIKELGEGFDNTIYVVNGQYVFRFPRREIAENLMKTEAVLLPFLQPLLPMKIPVPIFFGEKSKEYKWSFLGYDYLLGDMPAELDKSNRSKLIRPLAEFLKCLHHIPIAKLTDIPVPYDTLARLDIEKRKPRLIEKLKFLLELDSSPVLHMARNYVEKIEPIEVPKRHVLVHGDLHLGNMLVNQNKELTAIIDWGDVHIGHRAIDLAIVYSLININEREAFFSIYGEVDAISLELAKFKAVYTLVMLLAYASDKRNKKLYKEAMTSLAIALS
ncbi:phosphotransferase [Niallia circulans]|uniref:phosphotransferase n=1 Tax=Niallia circulans TaxID=1397 RepID=UPI001639D71A|nr:phosphotransferase [Niallia circulans]